MRDLNDIVENNTKATLDAIPAEQARGKYVVAKYTGVNFAGYDTFDTPEDANKAARAFRESGPGFTTMVYPALRPRTIHQSPLPANMIP